MRDFFINSLEKVVNVIVVLLGLAVLIGAAAATFGQGHMGPNGMGMGGGGPLAGLMVLIGGGLYIIVVGGFLYMGIGIYQNTRRSAEALEKLLAK